MDFRWLRRQPNVTIRQPFNIGLVADTSDFWIDGPCKSRTARPEHVLGRWNQAQHYSK